MLPFSANGTFIDYVYGFVSLDPPPGGVEEEAEPVEEAVEPVEDAVEPAETEPAPEPVEETLEPVEDVLELEPGARAAPEEPAPELLAEIEPVTGNSV